MLHLEKTATKGFTLVELMIVVTIIAILMMIMLPSYEVYVLKAKRSVGKAELLAVLARQEQFFVLNKQYASRLDLLGYGANPYAINANGEWVEATSPGRIYIISLFELVPAMAPQAFTLRAMPQLAQAGDTRCGYLQITSLGVESAGEGTAFDCW